MKIENSMNQNDLFVKMQLGGRNQQDSQMKSIQNQITNVQEQLQSLSENEDMTAKQKLEKQKELEQQMQDLSKQLMERQMEMQKEKREKQANEVEKQLPQTKAEENHTGSHLGTSAMHGILSANNGMEQLKATNKTRKSMEGRAHVVEFEMELDKSRGLAPSEYSIKELSNLNSKIHNVAKNMSNQIAGVKQTLSETQESDSDTDKANSEKEEGENQDASHPYHPVDIRL